MKNKVYNLLTAAQESCGSIVRMLAIYNYISWTRCIIYVAIMFRLANRTMHTYFWNNEGLWRSLENTITLPHISSKFSCWVSATTGSQSSLKARKANRRTVLRHMLLCESTFLP